MELQNQNHMKKLINKIPPKLERENSLGPQTFRGVHMHVVKLIAE